MISVIIRNFNNAPTIKRAIDSVLSQSLGLNEIEIVVIDDGSDDDSLAQILHFKKNIRFFQTKRLGAIKALNFGLRKSKGEFYTILDSDDYLPIDALKLLKKGLKKDYDAVCAYGDYYEFDFESSQRKYYSTKENIFLTVAGGLLFKTNIVAKLGYYDEQLFFPEYDILKKIVKEYKLVHVPEIVYYYCRCFGSITFNKKKVKEGINQLFRKYHEKLPIRRY